MQLQLLVGGEVALGLADLAPDGHDDQAGGARGHGEPKGVFVAPPQARLVHGVGLDDVAEAEDDGHAELEDAVDQAARETLPGGRQLRGDEDADQRVRQVDAHGGQDVRREYPSPVAPALGDEGQEEGRADGRRPGHDQQGPPGHQVQEVAFQDVEDDAADGRGREPSHDLQGCGAHDVLEVLGAVEEVDAAIAVQQEQGDGELRHAGGREDVGRQEGHLGDPALDVRRDEQHDAADAEERGDVGCAPASRGMCRFRDGEHDQDDPRHNGHGAEPVHDDPVLASLLGVVGYEDGRRDEHQEGQ